MVVLDTSSDLINKDKGERKNESLPVPYFVNLAYTLMHITAEDFIIITFFFSKLLMLWKLFSKISTLKCKIISRITSDVFYSGDTCLI